MICHRCGSIVDDSRLTCPGCGLDLPARSSAGDTKVETSLPTSSGDKGKYAGFWRRAAALMIDRALLGFVNFSLSVLYAIVSGVEPDSEAMGEIVLASAIFGFLLRWLYHTLMESSSMQATIGKAALGILVTDDRGGRISTVRANGRYWAKIVSAIPLGFGFLMAGFTPRRQALHDLIAGTLVVRR